MTSLEIFNQHESNARSYVRAFPVVFDKAKGSTMWDTDGNEYIDFFAGAGAQNYGHNPDAAKEALIDYVQRDGITQSLDMATVAKADFIESFQAHILEPRGLDYKLQFVGPTGTNAVEAALKLARLNTGRTEVVSFRNGFHGVSLGALATTSNPYFRDAAGVDLDHTNFINYDQPTESVEASLARLEEELTASIDEHGVPAAVLVEAMQGEGGVNIARPEWLQKLRQLTEERDIQLIVDDIQAGCGRSGEFFSFEEAGIVPDLVTLSKSISGNGSPMSLVLIKPELDIWKPAQHNGTHRGNNLAFVTAKAMIDTYWQDNELSQEVKKKSEVISHTLAAIALNHPELGLTVRGRGMMYGLVFEDPALAAEVAKASFDNGLVIERAGPEDEVVKIMPALTIEEDLLRQGLGVIEQSIRQVTEQAA